MLMPLVGLFMQQLAPTLTLSSTTLLSLWPTFLNSLVYRQAYISLPTRNCQNMAFNMVDINPLHLVASLVVMMLIGQVTCKHENLPLDMYLLLAQKLCCVSLKSNNQWLYLPLRPNILLLIPLLNSQLGYINFLKISVIHNFSL
jgi:hypothetical protein